MGWLSDYYEGKDNEDSSGQSHWPSKEKKLYESDNPQFDHLINNLEGNYDD